MNETYDIIEKKIDYINVESYDMNSIPSNVTISTMSITCHLGTTFLLSNIDKYMLLETNNIIAIKSAQGIRCMSFYYDKLKKPSKKSKSFFNQLTIIMRVNENEYMNVKLFKNGSIQITGCKKLSNCNIILNKLINRLNEIVCIKNNNEMTEIEFIQDKNSIVISDFKINMINSNFSVNYSINRENLYKLLVDTNIQRRFEPGIHACVNIKYNIVNGGLNNQDHKVSIFVFQTGNIIITGAKNSYQIKEAYTYIINLLTINKSKIMQKNISNLLNENELDNIINKS
jgi:TATA-box binding protein (TBP) (component of TFIID and TFIIIB)